MTTYTRDRWRAVGSFITQALKAKKWSQARLVRESGVSQPVVAELMKGVVKHGRDEATLERVSEALTRDPSTLQRILRGEHVPIPESDVAELSAAADLAALEAKLDQLIEGQVAVVAAVSSSIADATIAVTDQLVKLGKEVASLRRRLDRADAAGR